jgi:hypothetical protein
VDPEGGLGGFLGMQSQIDDQLLTGFFFPQNLGTESPNSLLGNLFSALPRLFCLSQVSRHVESERHSQVFPYSPEHVVSGNREKNSILWVSQAPPGSRAACNLSNKKKKEKLPFTKCLLCAEYFLDVTYLTFRIIP